MIKYVFSLVLIINLCVMTSHGASSDTDDCFPGTSVPPTPSVRGQRENKRNLEVESAANAQTSGVKRKLGAAFSEASASVAIRPSAGKCPKKADTDEDEGIAFMAASSTPHREGESAALTFPGLSIAIPAAVEKTKKASGWFIEFQMMHREAIEDADRSAAAGAGAAARRPAIIELDYSKKLEDISNFQSFMKGLKILTTGVIAHADRPWLVHLDLSHNPLGAMGLTLDPSATEGPGLNAVLSYPDFLEKTLEELAMLEPVKEVTLDLSSIAHKLQKLILKDCGLSTFSIRSETLEVLDLSGNPLISLDGIYAPELRSLKIDKTHMKTFDFRKLRDQFPKLRNLVT